MLRLAAILAGIFTAGFTLADEPAANAAKGKAKPRPAAFEEKAEASASSSAKATAGGGTVRPAQGKMAKPLKPTTKPAAGTDIAEEPAAVDGRAAGGNLASSVQRINGRKVIMVSEENRTIVITEKSGGAVSVLAMTLKEDDSEEVKRYSAGSVEELSVKHPDGFKLYQMYAKIADPKPRGAAGGRGGPLADIEGLEGVDFEAAQEKARRELEKLKESPELDDAGRKLLEQALRGLGGAGVP